MKRILVTNDDGIESPGLYALAEAMTDLGEVVVFAPSREYSGAGTAIGHLSAGIADVHAVVCPELDRMQAHMFDGPPALAALLAIKGLFGEPPAVVVSGINPGWNVGLAVLFSGTIGAALTAQQLGVPGVAVSQPTGGPQHWETAATAAHEVVDRLGPEPVALNVNVPNLPASDLAGTRATILSDRVPYRLTNARLEANPDGSAAVRFDRTGTFHADDSSDTTAVEGGYVSVTRLRPTTSW